MKILFTESIYKYHQKAMWGQDWQTTKSKMGFMYALETYTLDSLGEINPLTAQYQGGN